MPKVWPYFLGLLAMIAVLLLTACKAKAQDVPLLQERLMQSASMAGAIVTCGESFPDEKAYETAFEMVIERLVTKIDALGLTRSPIDTALAQVAMSSAQRGVWIEKVGDTWAEHPVRSDRVACDELVRRSLLYTQEPM